MNSPTMAKTTPGAASERRALPMSAAQRSTKGRSLASIDVWLKFALTRAGTQAAWRNLAPKRAGSHRLTASSEAITNPCYASPESEEVAPAADDAPYAGDHRRRSVAIYLDLPARFIVLDRQGSGTWARGTRKLTLNPRDRSGSFDGFGSAPCESRRQLEYVVYVGLFASFLRITTCLFQSVSEHFWDGLSHRRVRRTSLPFTETLLPSASKVPSGRFASNLLGAIRVGRRFPGKATWISWPTYREMRLVGVGAS